MAPPLNYDPEGRKFRDYLLDGGLRGRIFVNVHNGNKPYIVTRVFGDASLPNMNIEEVCSDGEFLGSNIVNHLDDPEYAPEAVSTQTPINWRVDESRLAEGLVKVTLKKGD